MGMAPKELPYCVERLLTGAFHPHPNLPLDGARDCMSPRGSGDSTADDFVEAADGVDVLVCSA